MNITDVYNAFFEGAGFEAQSLAFIIIMVLVGVICIWAIVSLFQGGVAEDTQKGDASFVIYRLFKVVAMIVIALSVFIGFIVLIYEKGFPLNLM